MTAPTLIKGLQNPTHDSQGIFRQLLKAMSEPGTLVPISSPESIETLYASTFAVCQALMDQQTPLWLSPQLDTQNVKHNLHFHTGVPVIEQSKEAMFAVMNAKESDLFNAITQNFSQGTDEYPETGCTLIVQVNSIKDMLSNQTNLYLTGPGIEEEHLVSISDLSPSLIDYLSNVTGERNLSFPLGLDVIFIDQSQLVCLPRTTQVEVL